jgi:hypothetical protein
VYALCRRSRQAEPAGSPRRAGDPGAGSVCSLEHPAVVRAPDFRGPARLRGLMSLRNREKPGDFRRSGRSRRRKNGTSGASSAQPMASKTTPGNTGRNKPATPTTRLPQPST